MLIASLVVLALGAQPAYRAADVTVSYVNGTSPTFILGLDNNLDVCLAAPQPVSLDDLRARGIPVSDSQRVLLLAFNILARTSDGRYRCEIPVFRDEIATRIRADAASIARQIVDRTSDARKSLLKTITTPSAYPIVASLVLDHLVWKELEAQGMMTSADPSTMPSGSKLWTGFAWIILPPATEKFGTNVYSSGSSDLLITWTPAAMPLINTITPEMRAVLLKEGDGEVPEIHTGSETYRAARVLAKETASAFAKAFDQAAFAKYTAIADRQKAILIVWHEVFPALMRILRDEVPPPEVLLGGGNGSLRDVMVIVRHRE